MCLLGQLLLLSVLDAQDTDCLNSTRAKVPIHSPTQQVLEDMYMPRFPKRPSDIITVRIVDRRKRTMFLQRIRQAVADCGGTVMVDLADTTGFM
jgi:hypothetical protein